MWLSGWTYRKQVTLTGQTGAGTNYQVLLKVGESSGATGEDFDVEGNSSDFPSAKNDGGDLRFTASDGTTTLPFWIEKVEGTTPNRLAYVWVKVSADLGSNQDVYCYYGNSSSPANGSDGDDTFELFDDFEGTGSVDSLKWGTKYTVSLQGDSTVRIGGTSGQYNGLFSLDTFGEGYSVIAYTKIYGTTVGTHNSGSFGSNTGNGSNVGYQTQWNSPYQLFKYGSNSSVNLPSPFDNSYYRFETKRKGNGKAELLVDFNSEASASSGAFTDDFYISSWAYRSDYNYIDYVAVRKCQDTEPSFNTAGSEEVEVTGTMIKRWNGTAWEEKPLKRYNGSEWENITIKRYNGSSWDEL